MSQVASNQQGAIAIFLSSVLAMLLLITTTYAARLQVSEIQQSSQVDRSEQAYYAAEAGIEEALRRIDAYPDASKEQLFPDNAGAGDKAVLVDQNGTWLSDPVVSADTESDSAAVVGQLAWRNRKIYGTPLMIGSLIKDESVQFDASQLARACAGGVPAVAGSDNLDCNGESIFSHFGGMQFSWNNTGRDVDPVVELTVVSWIGNNFTNTETNKLLFEVDQSATVSGKWGNSVRRCTSGSDSCFEYVVSNTNLASARNPLTARHYILRFKAIYEGSVGASSSVNDHNAFSLKYQAKILDTQPEGNLAVSDDSFVIDVVGQSGDIRRRVVAAKQRNGRLIGIFDYLIYSEGTSNPLCKAGVKEGGYSAECVNVETGDPLGLEYRAPYKHIGAAVKHWSKNS